MDRSSAIRGVVLDDTLVYQHDGRLVTLAVDAPSWFAWVQAATSFTFRNDEGCFTAHKARASHGRGGWYWYAYRRWRGRLFKRYLGTSEHLTVYRLRETTRALTARIRDAGRTQPASSPSPQASVMVVGNKELLTTKLHLPPLPIPHISRPRLLAYLDQCVQRPLTLVSAPAGSGKTTLLAEWARTTTRPVAWLSLEAAENDSSRFLAYLLAALASLEKRMDIAVHMDWWPDYEQVLTHLLNDLEQWLEQDAVVILDNAHLLTADATQAALLFLLAHPPARLHLLIGTRTDPPLPLSRLQAQGQLSELRAEELRLVSTEVGALARAMRLALSDEARDLLQEHTRGWVTGVRLWLCQCGYTDSSQSLRALLHGDHRVLLDYVHEAILAELPPETQRFLLRTCILEQMTAELCDAVTGDTRGEAEAHLAALQQAQLFVSAVDETGSCFRYHPFFAETLRTHLHQQTPEIVPALYRRAADWYEQHQNEEEACTYALLAGDFPHAANLLAGLLPHLAEQRRLEQLRRWLDCGTRGHASGSMRCTSGSHV